MTSASDQNTHEKETGNHRGFISFLSLSACFLVLDQLCLSGVGVGQFGAQSWVQDGDEQRWQEDGHRQVMLIPSGIYV